MEIQVRVRGEVGRGGKGLGLAQEMGVAAGGPGNRSSAPCERYGSRSFGNYHLVPSSSLASERGLEKADFIHTDEVWEIRSVLLCLCPVSCVVCPGCCCLDCCCGIWAAGWFILISHCGPWGSNGKACHLLWTVQFGTCGSCCAGVSPLAFLPFANSSGN